MLLQIHTNICVFAYETHALKEAGMGRGFHVCV
jgi:hypothetical protein